VTKYLEKSQTFGNQISYFKKPTSKEEIMSKLKKYFELNNKERIEPTKLFRMQLK
jgi:hypothetical protein